MLTLEAFETGMTDIEAQLRSRGIEVPFRPLAALAEWSKRLGVSVPLAGPETLSEGISPDNLGHHIERWYSRLYGDRLKLNDFSPGRVALLIRNDLWVVRIPPVIGTVTYVACKIPGHSHDLTKGEYNILGLFAGMTGAYRASLSEADLSGALQAFSLGLHALTPLWWAAGLDALAKAARADHDAATQHLSPGFLHAGLSRWSSQQAVEKLLKSVLVSGGVSVPRSHDLKQLSVSLTSRFGIQLSAADLTGVSCRPGVRYGEEPSTIPEAVNAHHCALRITTVLAPHFRRPSV